MLLPLWGRAVETQKEKPLLVDETALRIVSEIDYNFSTIAQNTDPLSQAAWIARSIYFDKEIGEYLERYPEASIINIGCGLDTTYDRVNNGRAHWYEIDLPDVIAVRRKFIKESSNRSFIAESVAEKEWYKSIKNRDRVFIMLAGVIYYFDEAQVRELFREFSKQFKEAEVVFDYCSKKGLEITNQKVIGKGGISKEIILKWSTEDIYELERWDNRIKVKKTMPMFAEHKKKYPIEKQTGMNISDSMKIMSLTYIEIARG